MCLNLSKNRLLSGRVAAADFALLALLDLAEAGLRLCLDVRGNGREALQYLFKVLKKQSRRPAV